MKKEIPIKRLKISFEVQPYEKAARDVLNSKITVKLGSMVLSSGEARNYAAINKKDGNFELHFQCQEPIAVRDKPITISFD